MCASNCIATVWTEPFSILTWVMTVSLCIRQESKRNDDSVSVEELDSSAESQVLILTKHLCCDFKCRPWAINSSLNTNDLYIHYMDKSTGIHPSLEAEKALPNCGKKLINVLKKIISTSVVTWPFWGRWRPIVLQHSESSVKVWLCMMEVQLEEHCSSPV